MARSAAVAKMGFYPAADSAIDGILKHLKLPDLKPDMVCALDPCAGEGIAMKRLTEGLEIPKDRVYCVELDKARAEAVRTLMPEANVVHASYLGTQVTQYSMSLVYMNPPYDHELGGGRREELSFLMRATWTLVPGGILCFVIPISTLKNRSTVEYLDGHYEQIRVFRFPKDVRNYSEIVVFGVRRKIDLPQDSIRTHGDLSKQGYQWGYGGEGNYLSELGHPAATMNQYGERGKCEDEVYVYELRATYAPHTFKKIAFTTDELQVAVAGSPLGRLLSHSEAPPPKRPPLPLGKGHVALLLASGMLDGVVSTPDGCHVVRGTSRKEEYVSARVCTENQDTGVVTDKVVHSQRIVMTIRAVDSTGHIKTFSDSPGAVVPETDPEEKAKEVKAKVVDNDENLNRDKNAHRKATRDMVPFSSLTDRPPILSPAQEKSERDMGRPALAKEVLAIAGPVVTHRSYKVGFTSESSNGSPAYNSIRFTTKELAREWATEQMVVRPKVRSFCVVGTDDEPNATEQPKETSTRSWKVACYTPGQESPSFNGVRFQFRNDAQRYGDDLFSRWTALDRFEVVESDDEPNR